MEQNFQETVDYFSNLNFNPEIAIVLGSGLSDFVKGTKIEKEIPFDQIPNFPRTSVEGHQGKLILAEKENKKLVILSGRVHAYEGFPIQEVVFPVRTLGLWGIKKLILTNASGGINTSYQPGDLALITDHINFLGTNPLVGPNNEKLGVRFPDMSETYDPLLRDAFKKASVDTKIPLHEGIYLGVLGPSYETPAEIKAFRTLGADMVGMSTVAEAIAAHHMGIRVVGISCITNMAAGVLEGKLSHKEVKEVASKSMNNFTELLNTSLKYI